MERLMKVREAADYLKQSVYTVRNWIKSGRLRAKRVGRDYLITEGAIREIVSPPERSRLGVEESLKRMRELQAEGVRAGIGPQTYKKAMAALEVRETESQEEMKRMFGGSSS